MGSSQQPNCSFDPKAETKKSQAASIIQCGLALGDFHQLYSTKQGVVETVYT